MAKKAYYQQEDMRMKLNMARSSSYHVWITNNIHGKIEYHVNILPGTFYSKSRERLRHARSLHNFKQGHGWIEHIYMSKTSLLNILKRSMDVTVATWIHGITITAEHGLKTAISRSLVCMLVLVTTQITKIHGIHPCKDGMAQIKTYVRLKFIRYTH